MAYSAERPAAGALGRDPLGARRRPRTRAPSADQPAEVAPARQSGTPAALPALVFPLDPLSEATPPAKWNPQGENPSVARTRTGEGAVTHGPRVMLVTWPGTVKALSCPTNPARVCRGLLIPARKRACTRRLVPRGARQARQAAPSRGWKRAWANPGSQGTGRHNPARVLHSA
jgi:hypothetical protein